ncbi:Hypothetical protein, putative [Bodo saltans]|uniref:RING-CH-type domain-containing protein n=1 Tax=Bodo saltans TaxID=75058 RepID=A0A0S4JMJ8_BODSA|nr:Hypothetical protein, putative [Bodo saltans]|eukprot:CUG91470.1 Hypothetical protein, putative [Bodo saltans]
MESIEKPMTDERTSFVAHSNNKNSNDVNYGDSDFQRSQSMFVEMPILGERFINGPDGVVYGKIASTTEPASSVATCWYCRRGDPIGELFKPCSCDSFIHRSCLRQWRAGWINPRNYFSCPNCMYSYNLEQVRPPTTESKERMLSNYRMSVIKVWVMVLLAFAGIVAALAGISYGSDTADKNIPVAVRCLLTSVVAGFPNSNSTTRWREDFKQPDVAVWPYYTVFGLFLTSVLVLISFACFGSTFQESDRRRTGHCSCVDDCCNGATNGLYVWTVPDRACCDCTVGSGGCNGCGRNSCSGGGGCGGCGDCNVGDAGPIIAVIVLIIVVVVIFSAMVVVALFAIQKCSLLYDRLTAMLASQQSELEGETVVLGIGESWRPNDAV